MCEVSDAQDAESDPSKLDFVSSHLFNLYVLHCSFAVYAFEAYLFIVLYEVSSHNSFGLNSHGFIIYYYLFF